MVQQPSAIASLASFLPMQVYLPDVSSVSDTQMTKLTLQEQMLKAGLVSSKKMAKVQRTAKKSRVAKPFSIATSRRERRSLRIHSINIRER